MKLRHFTCAIKAILIKPPKLRCKVVCRTKKNMAVLDYKEEPWKNRRDDLVVNCKSPYNAEPVASALVNNFLTPVSQSYIRNHGPVPRVDDNADGWEITFECADLKQTLNVGRLKQFPHVTIFAALQCAGNRRTELATLVKPVKGVGWGPCAIANNSWTGVRMCEVLASLGVENRPNWHLQMEGGDQCPEDKCYGSSIPLSKAMYVPFYVD